VIEAVALTRLQPALLPVVDAHDRIASLSHRTHTHTHAHHEFCNCAG
jgi:hypothetical protein